jgi:5-methylcytosine-specific restriction protein A
MHFPSPNLLFILIVILVIGFAVFQIVSSPRRRRARRGTLKKRRRVLHGILKELDHGARIARQHGHERSSEWSRVAKEHLRREPACVACGYKGRKRQVHHIKPFHLHPQLELDPQNLITLCEARGREHHLLLGHLDEWESYNEHIRADVKHFYRKTAAQIRSDLAWQKKMARRP